MEESALKQKELELKLKETEVTYQQVLASLENQKFEKEIQRQELLRRAVEVSSVALSRHPGNTGSEWGQQTGFKELGTLLIKATEKLTQAIDAL